MKRWMNIFCHIVIVYVLAVGVSCTQLYLATSSNPINPDDTLNQLFIEGGSRIPIGSSTQLHAILGDSKYFGVVEWQSDNTEVAQINDFGIIRARSIGVTEITAKSEDGLTGDILLEVYDPRFITKWQVRAGESVILPIIRSSSGQGSTLPDSGPGAGPLVSEYPGNRGAIIIDDADISIDWGDGCYEDIFLPISGGIKHTYQSTGEFVVEIRGILKLSVWSFLQVPQSKDMFIDVLNWGDAVISNNLGAFAGCDNLIKFSAEDSPALDGSLNSMFLGATNFTGEGVSHWDISNVTSMNSFFENTPSLQASFSEWDVRDKKVSSMFINSGLTNPDDHPLGCSDCGVCPNLVE